MHRPIPHDAERRLSRAVSEAPSLAGPFDRIRRGLGATDPHEALPAIDEFEEALSGQKISPDALGSAEKGLTELKDALGPDAYWKAATWRRLVAIFAGPRANIVLAIVLMSILLHDERRQGDVGGVGRANDSPAAEMGLQQGDRFVTIGGRPVTSPSDIPDLIARSEGKPIAVTVVRDGEVVGLGPVAPERIDDATGSASSSTGPARRRSRRSATPST